MDPLVFSVFVLAITGSIIGFASGLLGLGGGFLMVPVQFWLLTMLGIDPTIAIRVSFGTCLAVVIPTALSSSWGHHCRQCVLLDPLKYMAVPAFAGSFFGAMISTHAPGKVMEALFGILIIVAAIIMLVMRTPDKSPGITGNRWIYVLWGTGFGLVSGLFGIGGGVVMIPVMTILLGFSMHESIGTSAAVMFASAAGGVISFIVNGLGVPGLPPYSIGYIDGLQWIVLVAASVPMAQLGVRAAHALPADKIKKVLIIVMVIVGLNMIGIFG